AQLSSDAVHEDVEQHGGPKGRHVVDPRVAPEDQLSEHHWAHDAEASDVVVELLGQAPAMDELASELPDLEGVPSDFDGFEGRQPPIEDGGPEQSDDQRFVERRLSGPGE